MQIYYETTADIPKNHQIHLQLPENIPVGQVRIVIYELKSQVNSQQKTLLDFLEVGKIHGRFASIEEIDDFIANNRETWLCND